MSNGKVYQRSKQETKLYIWEWENIQAWTLKEREVDRESHACQNDGSGVTIFSSNVTTICEKKLRNVWNNK